MTFYYPLNPIPTTDMRVEIAVPVNHTYIRLSQQFSELIKFFIVAIQGTGQYNYYKGISEESLTIPQRRMYIKSLQSRSLSVLFYYLLKISRAID